MSFLLGALRNQSEIRELLLRRVNMFEAGLYLPSSLPLDSFSYCSGCGKGSTQNSGDIQLYEHQGL